MVMTSIIMNFVNINHKTPTRYINTHAYQIDKKIAAYDFSSSLYSYPYEENSDINIDMRSIEQKQVNSIAAYTDLQCGTGTVDIERVVLGNNMWYAKC